MNRRGFAEARLRLRSAELLIAGAPVELSLDCVTCRRRLRTVEFAAIDAPGRCTPTGHVFAGCLDTLHAAGDVVRAEFRYQFEPFDDIKYGNARYGSFEAGAPTWARLRFQLRCSSCGADRWAGTQSNLVRPWSAMCRCGATLYDDVEAPQFGWQGHETP